MSFILRGLHIASKQLAYLIIILSVLIAMAIGALYLLSDAVEQRRDEIAQWVSDQIHYPVTIGDADIKWLDVVPKLYISDITLQNKNRDMTIASLNSLYFGLDIIQSILKSEPVLSDMTLNGLKVAIYRTQSGQFAIQGMQALNDKNDISLAWLNILDRVQLHSTEVDYQDTLQPELSGHYQVINTQISHKKNRWNMVAEVKLPKQLGRQLQLQGKVTRNDQDWLTSHWQWQLNATHVNLKAISRHFIWSDVLIDKGQGTFNLSLSGQGKALDVLTGEVKISDLALKSATMKTDPFSVPIRELSGHIQWQNQTEQWQLSAENLTIDMNGEHWPETNLTITKTKDNDWIITSNYIRLSALSSIALLSEQSPEFIQKLQPAGEIKALNLHFSESGGLSELDFNLTDGALLPWRDFPGVTGLSMDAGWKNSRLNLTINSHELTLFADKWLQQAVFFDSVTGNIRFQKQQNQWALQTDSLRIWNDDLTLELDGNIEHQATGKVINNLNLVLENIKINQWQHYVPQRILTKAFKAWASDAFRDGEIVSGSISMTGDLADFPYDKPDANGALKLELNIEDVQLHYAPDWPDLMHVDGVIIGTGNDLVIKSQQGQIAGLNFINVTTTIDKLVESEPVLTTTGLLTGTTKQALAFIKNSPLKQRFYQAVVGVDAEGKSQVQLDLTVPLTKPEQTHVSGSVSFENSQLYYSSQPDIKLNHINGKLKFSGQGLQAKNIKAVLFDKPVDINVKPVDEDTIISLFGELSLQNIKKRWPDSVPTFIDGNTFYQAEVTVREKALGDFYIDTELHSDLKGIEINLPPPMGKRKQQAKALYLMMQQRGSIPYYQLHYADEIDILATKNNNNWRVGIKLGQGKAQLPEQGIRVRGKLTKLSLDDWLKWADSNQERKRVPLLEQLDDISMTIDELTGYQLKLTSLAFSANKDKQGWRIILQSDQTKGDIYWPLDLEQNTALDINLDRLELDFPKETENKILQKERELWPSMNIKIGALTINKMQLGQLEAKAQRNQNEWKLTTAKLSSDSYHAIINQGTWKQTTKGESTTLHAEMDISDLARLSSEWGYLPAMDSHHVKLNISLQWAADPIGFSAKNIKGELKFDVGQGKFNDIEPGAAGRIFGLMSIAALPQRLALDFSDIFSKEFNFNSIKGRFLIADGKATTNDFILKSPSAEITMKGPIDLVNRQYNQLVKIRPNVSSTLPLAGAVAGGPVGLGVGTAILLADKLVDSLFGKNIVNVISYKYTLKGSWDNPQFILLNPTNAK